MRKEIIFYISILGIISPLIISVLIAAYGAHLYAHTCARVAFIFLPVIVLVGTIKFILKYS